MPLVPERLVAACRGVPARAAWLASLQRVVADLQDRWGLSLGPPFDGGDVTCSWVAPAVRADGGGAVLKVGMPHMESAHEIQALQLCDGDPTVRLLEFDSGLDAMLLERCEPGTTLREQPEIEQDVVVADLLRRFWRRPASPHPFRPLAAMLTHWAEETEAAAFHWPDPGLVREGLRLFQELSCPAPDDVLLATDLHAGNILRARRRPWLMIDPKPFVGDCAYDATQHLLNCRERMVAAPDTTIRRFADLLEVDAERVRLWVFARAAADPRDIWDDDSMTLARVLS
jgi:streptomycin 6-kinase